MHVFNESNVFILFHFFMGVLWGALVFLGGAGAPASPSLAPPMLINCFCVSVAKMKNQMKILTHHLLIRHAFREKCIFMDYNERVFVSI